MPTIASLLNASGATTFAQTTTTASFSPVAGGVMYAIGWCERHNHSTPSDPSLTDSTGETWTVVNTSSEAGWVGDVNYSCRMKVWRRVVSSTTSRTLTFDWAVGSAAEFWASWIIIEITPVSGDFDPSDPVQQAIVTQCQTEGGGDSESATVALGSALTSGNAVLVVSARSNDVAGGQTSPSGYTQIANGTGIYNHNYAGYDLTPASNSVTITDLGQSVGASGQTIFEIKVASASVTVVPAAAALTLTGQVPVVLTPQTLAPANASLTLTGIAPLVLTPVVVVPPAVTLVLTGVAPVVTATDHQLLVPAAASLTLTGQVPAVLTPELLAPANATLVLTGIAPVVMVGGEVILVPDPAVLVLTGVAPEVLTPTALAPDPASLVLTGVAPVVETPTLLRPVQATLTLTGVAPTVTTTSHTVVGPTPGALVLTGVAPDVIVAVGSPTIIPAAVVLVLTGIVPVVIAGSVSPWAHPSGQGSARLPAAGPRGSARGPRP
jgi:hypothetical protein